MMFYASERKGILVLVLLIACLIILPRQFSRGKNDFFLLRDTIPLELDTVSLLELKIQQPIRTVELNTADSAVLDSVRGIGSYYAQKILRYRERLGGFFRVDQLKEVNMKYFNVDSMAHFFTVNAALIIKRDLDTMTFKDVLRHPYLDYEDVKAIFNAKRKNKVISYKILCEQQALPEDKLKKIKPYFQ